MAAVMNSGIDWHPSLAALPFSPIREMFNAAAGMDDVIHLSIGQPDFPTPPHIIDAFVEALRAGKTRYELDAGLPELRSAVAERYSTLYGRTFAPENVLITTGCCQAMYLALSAAVKPGKKVIYTEPVFVLAHIIEMAGAVPHPILTTAENGYQVNAQQIIDAIDDDTCAIMLNSPGNPTGAVYRRETIKAICAEAARRGLALISDEVYDRLVLDDGDYASVLNCADSLDNVIMASSVSKTYSMAGLRLGWTISSPENIEALQRYHMFVSATESTPAQWACVAALQGDQSCVDEMVDQYRLRRDRVVQLTADAPHLTGYRPGGAFFIMPSLPAGADGFDLAMRMLHEIRICTIPGGAFGNSCVNSLRISYATPIEQIESAFERMVPWLSRQSF